MGLYIPGMEMPKDYAVVVIYKDGTVRKYEDCVETVGGVIGKAVHVPEPHGRLGDLDALAQQVEHERFHHTHTDGLAARHHVAEYGHFLKAISDAPTIIPAEEGEA